MSTPYKTQVRDRIWALLAAHAPFTSLVLTGNRVIQDVDGWLRQRFHRAPNDFPQVALSNGRFTHSGFTHPPMTYAGESPTFGETGGHWIVRRKAEFILTITGRDTNADNIDPAEEAAQNALLAGGPRLAPSSMAAFTFVDSWGPMGAIQKEMTVQGAQRLVSAILIPVTMEFDGHVLVT